MLTYPDIDPVAVRIGPLAIHWYGLMYLAGFGAGWWLGRVRAKRPDSGWKPTHIDDLLFYVAVGIILPKTEISTPNSASIRTQSSIDPSWFAQTPVTL